ncbi:hypothetical protein LUX39_49745 [Actinomadura madurae]|nr:hypothetical protein [Actinomadura madurae]MCQ0020749.1 hypothetical protein [Actinomadura madurae]
MTLHYGRPDLAWRPITDIPPLRIALCWPLDGASRPVTDFADVVRHLAADS